jgi:hypothetical protein
MAGRTLNRQAWAALAAAIGLSGAACTTSASAVGDGQQADGTVPSSAWKDYDWTPVEFIHDGDKVDSLWLQDGLNAEASTEFTPTQADFMRVAVSADCTYQTVKVVPYGTVAFVTEELSRVAAAKDPLLEDAIGVAGTAWRVAYYTFPYSPITPAVSAIVTSATGVNPRCKVQVAFAERKYNEEVAQCAEVNFVVGSPDDGLFQTKSVTFLPGGSESARARARGWIDDQKQSETSAMTWHLSQGTCPDVASRIHCDAKIEPWCPRAAGDSPETATTVPEGRQLNECRARRQGLLSSSLPKRGMSKSDVHVAAYHACPEDG